MRQEGRRRILNNLNFQLQNEVGKQGQNTTLRSRHTLKCRLMFLLCFMTQLQRLQNVELEDTVNDELEGMKKETTVTYFKTYPGPRAYTNSGTSQMQSEIRHDAWKTIQAEKEYVFSRSLYQLLRAYNTLKYGNRYCLHMQA
jgi:hypothetical protein